MRVGSLPWPAISRCCASRKCTRIKYIFTVICACTLISSLIRSGLFDPYLPSDQLSSPRHGHKHPVTEMGLEDVWKSDELAIPQPILGSPMCPANPPGLGTRRIPALDDGENATATPSGSTAQPQNMSRKGGWWQPNHCQAHYHTAIIIPYRDRADNLRVLLRYLHPMLQKQLLHYRIFVAEQEGNGTYNKGRVMNSAFTIVRSRYPAYNCFVFHDVDMVPEDDRNLYVCQDQPRHLSPAVGKFNYTLPYKELIGGVLAMSAEQFVRVNGYANVFWGWGGEDDDMYYRIANRGYRIQRPPMDVGRYSMLPHVKRTWISHSKTYQLLARWKSRQLVDGLSNIKYELISMKPMPTYTHLLIRFETEKL